MKKTCKTSLGQGLCLWATGLVASVFLATTASAFFDGGALDAKYNLDNNNHINLSNTTEGKFKMSVETEGNAIMLGVGDNRSNLTPEAKFYMEDALGTYPENYWY